MSYEVIPGDVEQFILKSIDSIAQLEGLLLLRGNSEREWTAETLSKRLYVDKQQTAKLLARLVEEGLAVAKDSRPPSYRYQPNSEQLRQVVDMLADVYAKHLVPVTNLIHSKPSTRIREFADAFRLRKEEE